MGVYREEKAKNNRLGLPSFYKYSAFQAGFLGSWGKATTSGMVFACYYIFLHNYFVISHRKDKQSGEEQTECTSP